MISQERQEQLNEFLNSVNLTCNTELLDVALTHSSYCSENNLPFEFCNERLEFLGDAVLKLVISKYLYERFPQYHEGDMSQIRSIVVSDESLYQISEKINLKKYIQLGSGEETNGGRNRHSTIACAFEAILGALYSDGKLPDIINFLQNLFEDEITNVDREGIKSNTKALLQEYYQAFSNNVPEYVLTGQEGPPHDRTFYVDVLFEGMCLGTGSTKKSAQKDAAQKACEKVGLLGGKMNKILVAPSILSADFANLERDIKKIENAGADWVHIDVMDGHFVPNITIGVPVVKSLRKVTKLPLDVHLMIENPEKYLEPFAQAGADVLTVHYEAVKNPKDVLFKIRENGMKAGISINPKTPANVLDGLYDYIDLILVMTVEPGFGGQSFMENCAEKLLHYKDLKNIYLEVDGGINEKTSKIAVKNGANVLVAGNYVYNAENIAKAISLLRN